MEYTNISLAQVIEAPNRNFKPTSRQVFLAGGIVNCPDWQSEMIEKLKHNADLTIFNPRRAEYPMDDPAQAEVQITWEYEYLRDASVIAVWFSRGSTNPIVLYELGKWVTCRPEVTAYIGVDPEYERAQDVIIQTKLARPEIEIVHSIGALAAQVNQHLSQN